MKTYCVEDSKARRRAHIREMIDRDASTNEGWNDLARKIVHAEGWQEG